MLFAIQDDSLEPSQVLRPWSEIDFVTILVILGVAWATVFAFARLVRWLAGRVPTRVRPYLLPWPPILRLVVFTAAVVAVASMVLVPRPESMVAILGSAAVALGFAFKDYVSSLIAGVVVLFERPVNVGDWVRVGGVYGRVETMRLRVFELVTPDDDTVSVPYSMIWNDAVFSANDGRPDHLCVADFYLDPEHDAAEVRSVLEDVALTSAYRALARPVRVVANEEPFATHYRVKAYPFDGSDQFEFVTDITVRGKAALAELGVHPARVAVGPGAPGAGVASGSRAHGDRGGA